MSPPRSAAPEDMVTTAPPPLSTILGMACRHAWIVPSRSSCIVWSHTERSTSVTRLSAGIAPPPVSLYTYRLSGTITNAAGQPVQGAVVVTRTNDRDFWGTVDHEPDEVERIRPATEPNAMINSLGPAPLPGRETIAEHYFAAIYERAAALAREAS